MHISLPLNLLAAGQSGTIDQVLGPPAEVHRLREIGLREGAEVEMLQPGTPCMIRLVGHKLCFRADELLNVLVRMESDA